MKRVSRLPDFSDPPLDELVLGVQFAPVPGYGSVHSGRVWEQFKPDFPKVREQAPLEPQYETFGEHRIALEIRAGETPVPNRLWFFSNDGDRLLQFQRDRFIANWRRQSDDRPYPRFEKVAGDFKNNLTRLANHLANDFGYQIDIKQAEIAYTNIIRVEDFSRPGDWFNLWGDGLPNVELLHVGFSEVIKDASRNPFARLKYNIESVFSAKDGHKAFRLSLTYAGNPAENNIGSAMKFLGKGREALVTRFSAITTAKAHRLWGKTE